MNKETLFALTILEVLRLEFRSTYGRNPIHFGFENKKGNSIYVSRMNDRVTVSAFKVSRSCFSTEIENEIQIGIMSDELIKILKITAL